MAAPSVIHTSYLNRPPIRPQNAHFHNAKLQFAKRQVKYRAPSAASVLLEPNERLRLRLFIDKSVVEVFVNERQVMAERVFPSRDDSLGVSLRAQGNRAELKSLEAWQMKSIYP